GLCAMAPGTFTMHWQFSPPDPITRDTQMVDADNNNVSDPTLFTDYQLTIIGAPLPTMTYTPTPLPSNTPTNTRTRTFTRTPTRTNTPITGGTNTPTNTPTGTPTLAPTPTTAPCNGAHHYLVPDSASDPPNGGTVTTGQ